MGYSSGFCLKKVRIFNNLIITTKLLPPFSFVLQVSKVVSFFLGGAFILIQSLSYTGYIKVDYDGIKKDVEVRF